MSVVDNKPPSFGKKTWRQKQNKKRNQACRVSCKLPLKKEDLQGKGNAPLLRVEKKVEF